MEIESERKSFAYFAYSTVGLLTKNTSEGLRMTNYLSLIGLSAALTLGTVGYASAYTIDSGATDVGVLDNLLAGGSLGSGDQTEVNWVNATLATLGTITNFTTGDLTKYVSAADLWKQVDGSNGGDTWALDLVTDGGYFYIKTGNIQFVDAAGNNASLADDLSVPEHFLYTNNTSSNWAVVSFGDIVNLMNAFLVYNNQEGITVKSFDIDKFSHLGELGSTPVPEPTSMLLFGAGIAGLAGLRGRRRKS